MAKDPAFLFYYQDFLVGTAYMTPTDIGHYILMLCYQAAKGHLPKEQLSNICKSTEISAEVMSKFCVDKSGLLYNQRLENEVNKRRLYSLSRSKNRTYKKKICKTYVPHMENENTNENEDKNKKENEKKDFGETGIVKLTDKEHSKLVARFGQAEAEAKISQLEHAVGSKGYKYKSHYHTILSWAGRDGEKSSKKIRGMAEIEETARQIERELRT